MATKKLLHDLDCAGVSLLNSPTIITPTIVAFNNANHQHVNAAGGGLLSENSLSLADITTNDVTTGRHGFVPKAPNSTNTFLRGDATWATLSSVLLSTVTASNSTTVDFTSGINGTFRRYLIMVDGLRPATDIQILMIRVSLDSGLTWKANMSDYSWVATRNYSSSSATGGSPMASEIRVGAPGTSSNNFMSNVATEVGSLNVYIGDPSSGNRVPVWGDGAWYSAGGSPVGVSHCVFGGMYGTAGVVNGIRFLMSSGNITAGVFRLYGIT